MVQSKESKVKWTKVLDSIKTEQDLVKSICDELSQIKISSVGGKGTATRKQSKSKANSHDGKDPTEAARNIAGDYTDADGSDDESDEPEIDPFVFYFAIYNYLKLILLSDLKVMIKNLFLI